MTKERCRIVEDLKGYTYVIPAENWEEWDQLLDAEEGFVKPKWAKEIETFSSVTFEDWKRE